MYCQITASYKHLILISCTENGRSAQQSTVNNNNLFSISLSQYLSTELACTNRVVLVNTRSSSFHYYNIIVVLPLSRQQQSTEGSLNTWKRTSTTSRIAIVQKEDRHNKRHVSTAHRPRLIEESLAQEMDSQTEPVKVINNYEWPGSGREAKGTLLIEEFQKLISWHPWDSEGNAN